jgi:ATP-dependent exoDNAse (exonuclease V) beta subunit
VLGETTNRALLYVAMTRGRDANTAYLYERIAEGDHEHAEQPDSPHVMRRGTSHDAAQLVRGIIAARDEQARTAHQVAASTDREDLPDRVRSLSDRRAHAVQSRRTAYRHWHEETQELVAERQRWIDQHIGRDRSQDQGLDYGIDL